MNSKVSSIAAVKLLHEGSDFHSRLESTGMRINKSFIDKTMPEIEARIKTLTAKMKNDKVFKVWERTFGSKTNLDSPDQLRTIVYDKLGHKIEETTKTGKAKVSRAVLDEIDLPLLRIRDEVQKLQKTFGTFLTGIKREMVEHDDGDWYVHPVHNLHSASTYRPSAEAPNVRNVPKRDPEMSKFTRKCFLPMRGHHMVEIDFNMHEVRIGYCNHKDPVMKVYLEDDSSDMHRDASFDLFFMDPNEYKTWNKDQAGIWKKGPRDCAKNRFVFASFFGSTWLSPHGGIGTAQFTWQWIKRNRKLVLPNGLTLKKHLARNGVKELGPVEPGSDPSKGSWAYHVRQVDRKLWERFRVYDQWRKDIYTEYKRNGYMEYKTGFVVHTHHKRNDVINYVVQGPAYHCDLRCCIWLDKWLRKYKMKSRIINEVYDCIVMSVHPRELQDVLFKARYYMTKKLPKAWDWIITPMKTETEVAPVDADWSCLSEWTIQGNEWRLKV